MKTSKPIFILVLGTAIILVNSACTKTSSRSMKLRSGLNDGGESALVATVGLRNFMQLNQSMASVSGVPATNAVVAPVYGNVISRLNLDGHADTYTAATASGITTLAVTYCQEWMNKEKAITPPSAALRTTFQNVDFTQGPAAITTATRGMVVDNLSKAILGRLPSQEERTELLGCIADAATESASATPARSAPQQTMDALNCPCSALMSSQEFISI